MSKNRPGIGTSRYRQLRLTATHEISGHFSVSLYAKGLNQEWHERQCLMRWSDPGTGYPLNSTEDVILALVNVLEEHLLPLPGTTPSTRA